jgi:hypothetical protein
MSIKRHVILSDYSGAVDELYNVPVKTTNNAVG